MIKYSNCLMFMGLSLLMYSFKYNQQDATLYNILYCLQCSTCFRWFLHQSSGAQNYVQHLVYVKLASMGELDPPTLEVAASKLDIPDAVCTVLSS
jgi:hypothetical protein